MSTLDILMTAAGLSASSIVVSDFFATSLYTGNGSSQTINNGINLAGNGGMVWVKLRNNTTQPFITDTSRGATNTLQSNVTTANVIVSSALTAFNSSGFSVGFSSAVNSSTGNHVAWTFRKAPKFFDVVTYTGDGVNVRRIPHSLGVDCRLAIVKRLDTASNWKATYSDGTYERHLCLNLTDASDSTAALANGYVAMDSQKASNITLIQNTDMAAVNAIGGSYVAYLFAHDPSADGIIQCGSFTADSSGNASINLGYRPQFVLFKLTSASGNWVITDSARGMPTGTGDKVLLANSTAAETTTSIIDTSSTGFSLTGLGANVTGIYMAIKSAV